MAKVVFLIQMLPTFGGRCNRYFWDIRLKILRLPNFNMLFQLVLTKFFKSELFSCLPKVGHVIKSCKEPIHEVSTHLESCSWTVQKTKIESLITWSNDKFSKFSVVKTEAKCSFMYSEMSPSFVNVVPLSNLITIRSLDPYVWTADNSNKFCGHFCDSYH